MSKTEKIVTIKEVAKHAGVAISTVSRVLNHLDRVSEETRERVRRAAQELGYVKNNLAASMKTGSTKLIVVVVPDMVNEFYTAVVQGVEEVAVSQGYYPLVFATGDSREKERELFEGKFGRIIDGAVVIPAHTDMDFFKGLNKPCLLYTSRCV